MAARASLAALITELRVMVNDPEVGTPVFADSDYQSVLDDHRQEMRLVTLQGVPSFFPGNTVLFLDFYSDAKWWESDVKLQDMAYNDITANATLAELFIGHWQFTTQPNGIGVYATGKTFDLYGSAAAILRKWAGQLKLTFTFSSDSQKFQLTDQINNLLLIAREYEARALPRSIRMVQDDATPEQDGGGVVYPNWGNIYRGG